MGIGTDGPKAKLHIINKTQTAEGDSLILGPKDTSSHLRLGYHKDYSWIQSHGAKHLAINPIGNNVGIGTTSPADKLDINGDIRIRGANIKDAGGTARITLTDNGRLDLKEDGGTASLSIATTGNVGIGKTSPADKLDVNGDIRIRGADIKDAGGTARITLTDNGSLDLKEDGGSTSLSIATNGYVGIGTTDPGAKLQVNGSGFFGADRGGLPTKVGAGIRIFYQSRGNIFAYDYGKDEPKNLILQQPGGNVGIGTSSPSEKLQVSGTVKATVFEGNSAHVKGSISSPMWNVTRLFDREKGPLPIETSFNSGGGTLLIFASGTAFKRNSGLMSLHFYLDNRSIGYVDTYTNDGGHKAFPTQTFIKKPASGYHTFKIDKHPSDTDTDMVTDINDRFYLTILELPF